MDTQERIELLEDARESIDQAVGLIRQAIEGTKLEDYVEAYVIPALVLCARRESEYLGQQPANIDEVIERIEDEA